MLSSFLIDWLCMSESLERKIHSFKKRAPFVEVFTYWGNNYYCAQVVSLLNNDAQTIVMLSYIY